MVVSIIALVLALTGTAVAAKHLISGSSIKKHSIPGNRLANHSITAAQVNKSKLGTVPHASVADTAANAANAAKLGGAAPGAFLPSSALTRWSFAMNKGAGSRAITIGPLTLTASCEADTTKTDAKLVATTSEANTFVTNDPEALPGIAGAIISSGAAYTVVEQDTAMADDGNSNAFAAFDGQGKLAVFSTAQTLAVAINTPSADCRFFGYLVNDA